MKELVRTVPAGILALCVAVTCAGNARGAGARHAGAKYGHADSSVGKMLANTLVTRHFVFRFAEKPAALKDLFSTLEKNYARITAVFAPLPGRLSVEVYPDIGSYHKRTFGAGSPDWLVGNFDPDENVLRLASPDHPGSYHDRAGVLEAAVHEFAHAVTFNYRGRTREGLPVWLDEGVSVYFEGPLGKGTRERIGKAAASGSLPSLAELDKDFVGHSGYTFSGTVVEFILKRYGAGKLRLFVKDPSAYRAIFGLSQEEFGSAWHRYLKAEYGGASAPARGVPSGKKRPGSSPGL